MVRQRSSNKRRGQTLVEFALVTPIFLLVVFVGSMPEIWATITKKVTSHVALARVLMVALYAALAGLVFIADKKKKVNS